MTNFSEIAVFNLIREPWLPAQRRNGRVEWIQPWKVTDQINQDPFVAFAWPRPDFSGAALEFLIGLLSTAAAPKDDDEWRGWWSAPPQTHELEQKFMEVVQAFDLDGAGSRFLQDLDPLEGIQEKPITALLIDAPGAQTLRNNADLFVKRGAPAVFCRATAAIALYTLNSYAPSGGAGHRTSIRGGGPMTTLVIADHPELGNTLWGRLWPNVETTEQIENRASDAWVSEDINKIFPWLVPTRVSGPKGKGKLTTSSEVHPLQVYWGMPRRIRLNFEDPESNMACSLTGAKDSVVVKDFRTKNYGTNYTEGFEHPLTPYYRQKESSGKLPVHPQPGGIRYRLWPGIVVKSTDRLRTPAQTITNWGERGQGISQARIASFGYDMDNMKARAWIEGEMPLWHAGRAIEREVMDDLSCRLTAGASTVARLLISAVKSSLHDRPSEASGDYSFIAERFYRETEANFFAALGEVKISIEAYPDSDDPTYQTRENWVSALAAAALRLFDEFAPADGLEERNMQREVKARFFFMLALSGRGRDGRLLFERDLGIVPPETSQQRENKEGRT